jgi:hypothetical protein
MTWIGFYLEHLIAIIVVVALWNIFNFKERSDGSPTWTWRISVFVFMAGLVFSMYLKDVPDVNFLIF